MFKSCTSSQLGKNRHLNRIFNYEKCVIVPMDDSLISGSEQGLFDLDAKITEICSARPNAILGYVGSLSLLSRKSYDIPIILNLTASTERSTHTNKRLITNIE